MILIGVRPYYDYSNQLTIYTRLPCLIPNEVGRKNIRPRLPTNGIVEKRACFPFAFSEFRHQNGFDIKSTLINLNSKIYYAHARSESPRFYAV